jgi:hypothetical protein
LASHRWECPRCGVGYYWRVGFTSSRDMEEDIHRHLEKHRGISRQTTLLGSNVSDSMEVRTSRYQPKEVIDYNMKIGEVASKISFKRTPEVIIDYDPSAEAVEKAGQGNSTYLQIQVKQEGRIALLPVSQGLLTKLQPFTQPTRLKITRSGDGFTTTYAVEKVK